jgi:hypothetical protein
LGFADRYYTAAAHGSGDFGVAAGALGYANYFYAVGSA